MGRRDGCSGKVRHPTKHAAVGQMKTHNNAQLNTYPCKKCGGWHVGNSRKPHKVQARIDQILRGLKR